MQCKMLTASAFITQAASYFSSLKRQSAQLGIDVTTIFADVAMKEREIVVNCKEMSILNFMDIYHWRSRCDYSELSWNHDKRKKKQEIDQTVSSKYRRITFPCFIAFRKLGRKPKVSGISHYLLFTVTLKVSASDKQASCFSSHKPRFASPSRPAFLPGPCY